MPIKCQRTAFGWYYLLMIYFNGWENDDKAMIRKGIRIDRQPHLKSSAEKYILKDPFPYLKFAYHNKIVVLEA